MIDEAELQDVYRRQYWNAVKGDKLLAGVDYAVFGGAVNSGPEQSVKWLQRALGSVKVDGQIGEATLAAIERHLDHDRLIAAMLDRRLAFLQALKIWPTFRKGWSARVAQVKQIWQAWATGSVGPQPSFTGGNAKATIDQAKPLPGKGAADAATGAGVGTGSLAGTLEAVRQTLDPLAAGSIVIANVVTALVIVGVLLNSLASQVAGEAASSADDPDFPGSTTMLSANVMRNHAYLGAFKRGKGARRIASPRRRYRRRVKGSDDRGTG